MSREEHLVNPFPVPELEQYGDVLANLAFGLTEDPSTNPVTHLAQQLRSMPAPHVIKFAASTAAVIEKVSTAEDYYSYGWYTHFDPSKMKPFKGSVYGQISTADSVSRFFWRTIMLGDSNELYRALSKAPLGPEIPTALPVAEDNTLAAETYEIDEDDENPFIDIILTRAEDIDEHDTEAIGAPTALPYGESIISARARFFNRLVDASLDAAAPSSSELVRTTLNIFSDRELILAGMMLEASVSPALYYPPRLFGPLDYANANWRKDSITGLIADRNSMASYWTTHSGGIFWNEEFEQWWNRYAQNLAPEAAEFARQKLEKIFD